MDLNLSFHGGVGTVTGSRHLLAAGKTKVLVDAGLFQGLKELRLMNWEQPSFDAASLDHLVLTHTHIDHAGYLPRLARDGYSGPVHCTEGTQELAELLLMDAAKIQEEDADFANRKGYSKHKPALPLYTEEDARSALDLFRSYRYQEWLALGDGVRARFLNAGHILGSSLVELRVDEGARSIGVVFSGDVGRYDMPLHLDPTSPPACDFLVVESTYGDRQHPQESLGAQILEPFEKTFKRGGTVLIPAFAVGRAQLVTVVLHELMQSGKIPEVPVHIDSPMAVDATRIYGRHLRDENLDPDVLEEGRSPLFPSFVRFHRSVQESRKLNELPGPRIIISASGMLTAGRVLHHLARLLPERRNLVVLSGYQAAGTRGRALMEGARHLRIHGEEVPVKAEFMPLSGMSAHADSDELVRWVGAAENKPKAVFVTHGEPEASAALAKRLEGELGLRTIVPAMRDSFDLMRLMK